MQALRTYSQTIVEGLILGLILSCQSLSFTSIACSSFLRTRRQTAIIHKIFEKKSSSHVIYFQEED